MRKMILPMVAPEVHRIYLVKVQVAILQVSEEAIAEIIVSTIQVSAWTIRETKVFHAESCKSFEKTKIPDRSTAPFYKIRTFKCRS